MNSDSYGTYGQHQNSERRKIDKGRILIDCSLSKHVANVHAVSENDTDNETDSLKTWKNKHIQTHESNQVES